MVASQRRPLQIMTQLLRCHLTFSCIQQITLRSDLTSIWMQITYPGTRNLKRSCSIHPPCSGVTSSHMLFRPPRTPALRCSGTQNGPFHCYVVLKPFHISCVDDPHLITAASGQQRKLELLLRLTGNPCNLAPSPQYSNVRLMAS